MSTGHVQRPCATHCSVIRSPELRAAFFSLGKCCFEAFPKRRFVKEAPASRLALSAHAEALAESCAEGRDF